MCTIMFIWYSVMRPSSQRQSIVGDFPQKVRAAGGSQPVERLWNAHQQVQPRRELLDAVDEDGEMNARRPPHTVPRCSRAGQDTRQHVDECRAVDRRAAVEGDRAPTLQQ
jgi:hypothetical protein